ncbi:MAG: SNF2-related protein [Lachnotalea sp.]
MTTVELFEHQKEAITATEKFNRVAYYLDMGLGKTFVGSEKMWELNTDNNLVICQKSKIEDWVQHFQEFYSDEYIVYDLTKKSQLTDFLYKVEDKAKVGVINYELVFRRSYISHITGFTLLLDESSLIQNESAKRSKFILSLQPENVILLSGTPTAGKYENLWSQLHLLGWGISKKGYWNSFIVTDWLEDIETGFRMQIVVGYKNVERLKKKLTEHGAIFMKTDEAFELPQQKEVTIEVKKSAAYRKFIKESYVLMNDIELVGETSLTKLLYSRQLCGQYSKEKLSAFHDLVQSTEDRLIVFYNFYEELYTMRQSIVNLERPISIVNGQEKELKNYEEADNSVTFIQYQSGAMGLNLQKANKTVYFTLPLSAELFEQSKKRTHRIGQERTCFYYFLMCESSIEYKVLDTLKMRKDYNDKLFEKEFT